MVMVKLRKMYEGFKGMEIKQILLKGFSKNALSICSFYRAFDYNLVNCWIRLFPIDVTSLIYVSLNYFFYFKVYGNAYPQTFACLCHSVRAYV